MALIYVKSLGDDCRNYVDSHSGWTRVFGSCLTLYVGSDYYPYHDVGGEEDGHYVQFWCRDYGQNFPNAYGIRFKGVDEHRDKFMNEAFILKSLVQKQGRFTLDTHTMSLF